MQNAENGWTRFKYDDDLAIASQSQNTCQAAQEYRSYAGEGIQSIHLQEMTSLMICDYRPPLALDQAETYRLRRRTRHGRRACEGIGEAVIDACVSDKLKITASFAGTARGPSQEPPDT